MGGEQFSWPVDDEGKAGMLAAFLELGWAAELEQVLPEYSSGWVGRTKL